MLAQLPTVLLSTTSYAIIQLIVPHALSHPPHHLGSVPFPLPKPSKPLKSRDILLLSTKLIGSLHSLLSSTLALKLILSPTWAEHDLIHTTSQNGDRIVALELGYLLSDTVALMMMRRKLGDSALVRRVVSHHVVVGGLMGWYLFAAVRGKAKGVFFVASYMRYTAVSSHLISTIHSLSMAVYALVRLGLLYYQLWVYGQRKGLSAIEAFKTLPLVCRVSTTLLLFGNGVRFTQLSGIARRKRV
ncbi:MAG: hypothetical protein TREMPRED_000805 [Tremellales sp. Tagirdzhanova-0007]|nr:MAG: hypothetical protein TREMPRED_000805 [Tremellales sp. Tagirdzhanova-0007]